MPGLFPERQSNADLIDAQTQRLLQLAMIKSPQRMALENLAQNVPNALGQGIRSGMQNSFEEQHRQRTVMGALNTLSSANATPIQKQLARMTLGLKPEEETLSPELAIKTGQPIGTTLPSIKGKILSEKKESENMLPAELSKPLIEGAGLEYKPGTSISKGMATIYEAVARAKEKKEAAQEKKNKQEEEETALAEQMIQGKLPPSLIGGSMGGKKISVLAKAKKIDPKFDAGKAQLEYNAMNRYVSTQNGPEIQRNLKSIRAVRDSLTELVNVSNRVNRTTFPAINTLEFQAFLGPKSDPDLQKFALVLTEINSQLAQVFRAGGTPTDQTVQQAEKTLRKEFSKKSIVELSKELNRLLEYRLNAIGTNTAILPSMGMGLPQSSIQQPKLEEDYLNSKGY